MKKIFIIILNVFLFSTVNAENLNIYVQKAIKNNLKLNAERKNLETAKQNKIMSRSEFFPSLTISGDQISTTSTNRTDQTGTL